MDFREYEINKQLFREMEKITEAMKQSKNSPGSKHILDSDRINNTEIISRLKNTIL